MRTIVVGALWAIAMVANANAAIKEKPVTYKDGETTLKGFVVYDDAITAKRPGIVMVHEWWGITNHIRNEARKSHSRATQPSLLTCTGTPRPPTIRRTQV